MASLLYAFMLTTMKAPADLLRDARARAGLSVRELADCAGVAPSTIARIETGRVDPTTGMLERLVRATGRELRLELDGPATPEVRELITEWETDVDGQDRPDWTAFRSFIDHIERNPLLAASSTAQRPDPSGSAFIDNLIAGIAEKIRDDRRLPRPSWTRRIRPLDSEWMSLGTPRMRVRARATTPPQLAARNIYMTADSLWRNVSNSGH